MVKKEFSAGLVIYRQTDQGPRFLLLYHGGRYWNFPKGHIEEKLPETVLGAPEITELSGDVAEGAIQAIRETSKEAAIRETFEEAGIDPKKISIKPGFRSVQRFKFRRDNQDIFKTVIFYLAETDQPEIKISDEHEGFAWFLYKDAKYILAMYKDSQKLLRSAYDYVRGKKTVDLPVMPHKNIQARSTRPVVPPILRQNTGGQQGPRPLRPRQYPPTLKPFSQMPNVTEKRNETGNAGTGGISRSKFPPRRDNGPRGNDRPRIEPPTNDYFGGVRPRRPR